MFKEIKEIPTKPGTQFIAILEVVSTVLAKTKPIHEIADSPTYDKIITNCVAYDTNPKIFTNQG